MNQEIDYMWNDMDSCLLLKVWAINMEKKIVDTAKKSATNAIKTASKKAIQKTAEATGYLVGYQIADKITSVSKKSTKKLPTIDQDVEWTTHKKRYISPEKIQQIIDALRLIPKN